MFTEFPPTKKQKKQPVYVSLCLCAFGAMDQMTYICFCFSDLYTSVQFIGYIESMFFLFLFFCESSVGLGAVWVDLSDLILIFNFCATLAHREV